MLLAILVTAIISKEAEKKFIAVLVRDDSYSVNGDMNWLCVDGVNYAMLQPYESGYEYLCKYDDNLNIIAEPIGLLNEGWPILSLIDKSYIYEFNEYKNRLFLYCDMDVLGYSDKIYYRSDFVFPEIKTENIKDISFESIDADDSVPDFTVTDRRRIDKIVKSYSENTDIDLNFVIKNNSLCSKYYVTVDFNDYDNFIYNMGYLNVLDSNFKRCSTYRWSRETWE